MTKDKDIVLTEKEQELFSKEKPELLKAIEQNSPVARAWLASLRNPKSAVEEAQIQANEIRQEIMKAPPEQGILQQWCGLPTDMTRCSPFFPMNSKILGERKFLQNFIITSANWGEIKYTGPQLSTYEEDVLLAVLALLDKQSYERHLSYIIQDMSEDKIPQSFVVNSKNDVPDDVQDCLERTYTYKGAILPLLKLLGITRRPSKKDYKRIIDSLELLVANSVKIFVSAGKTKAGKKRQPRITHMSNMLTQATWDDKEKILTVTINPFFYEMYMSGRVTLMDVSKRMSLKGVITKALYRFVQSQQNGFTGHFLTLADALNMDRKQPNKNTKRFFKTAINELIEHNVLTKKSGFIDENLITLICVPMKKQENTMQHIE